MADKKAVLLPSQRARVFELLKLDNHDMASFRWKEEMLPQAITGTPPAVVSVLSHPSTGFFFQFDMRSETFWCTFSPGTEKPERFEPARTWHELEKLVAVWSRTVAREIKSPDPWAEFAKEHALSDLGAKTTDNEPFSKHEAESIKKAIEGIRGYLESSADLQREQFAEVNARLDYLSESTERLGKKDFINAAVGVLFSIAAEYVRPTAAAFMRTAWDMLSSAFAGIAGLLA